MKKIIINTLFTLLLITSCSVKTSTDDLTILCPTGAPAIAFYQHSSNRHFTTNSSPATIVSSMTKNGSDIIIIDTIKGIDAIKNGAPYQLAANITFGNFYIASTGNDDNGIMDKDDVIVNFGYGQTPQKVFELLYGEDYTELLYVDNVSMAAKCLQTKKTLDNSKNVDYVFIAEPALTQSLTMNLEASIYANIQEVYQQTVNLELIQAGVFVKQTTNKKAIEEFLKNLSYDITTLIDNPSILDSTVTNLTNEEFTTKYGIGLPAVKNCLVNQNSIGLGFKMAKDNLQSIEEFCKLFHLNVEQNEIYQ